MQATAPGGICRRLTQAGYAGDCPRRDMQATDPGGICRRLTQATDRGRGASISFPCLSSPLSLSPLQLLPLPLPYLCLPLISLPCLSFPRLSFPLLSLQCLLLLLRCPLSLWRSPAKILCALCPLCAVFSPPISPFPVARTWSVSTATSTGDGAHEVGSRSRPCW